jgi:hypothetical protein
MSVSNFHLKFFVYISSIKHLFSNSINMHSIYFCRQLPMLINAYGDYRKFWLILRSSYFFSLSYTVRRLFSLHHQCPQTNIWFYYAFGKLHFCSIGHVFIICQYIPFFVLLIFTFYSFFIVITLPVLSAFCTFCSISLQLQELQYKRNNKTNKQKRP